MTKLISQKAICSSRGDGAIWRPPEHSWTSDKPQKQATAKAPWATFSTNIWLNCQVLCAAIIWWWKCALLLCAWKAAFLKSSHIWRNAHSTNMQQHIAYNIWSSSAHGTKQYSLHNMQCSQHTVHRMQYMKQCPWHKAPMSTTYSSTLHKILYEVEVLMAQNMQQYTA